MPGQGVLSTRPGDQSGGGGTHTGAQRPLRSAAGLRQAILQHENQAHPAVDPTSRLPLSWTPTYHRGSSRRGPTSRISLPWTPGPLIMPGTPTCHQDSSCRGPVFRAPPAADPNLPQRPLLPRTPTHHQGHSCRGPQLTTRTPPAEGPTSGLLLPWTPTYAPHAGDPTSRPPCRGLQQPSQHRLRSHILLPI